jgi:dTDP-4-dehydrorhamnose reductase
MHWAVIGDRGLLGSELARLLENRGEDVTRFNRTNLNNELSTSEISSLMSRADVVVNAVGYTQVDKAETDAASANLVNGNYAGKLAQAAAMVDARYFYISTDYVFDGLAISPYSVMAKTNPQSVYGKSKQLGEELVAQSGANYTIFRTSWLYGASGKDFPKAVSAKLLEKGSVKVVNDQFGAPTWARDLAEVLYQHGVSDFAEKVVHSVASGVASWFDFALEVAQALPESDKFLLTSASTLEVPTLANRPKFSVLDNSETKGPIIGDWRERWRIAAPEVLAQFLAK